MLFKYNKDGLPIPPQTADMLFGLLTAYLGLVIPFAVFIKTGQWPLSPILLQHTPTFWIFESAGIITVNEIAKLEFILLLYCAVSFCDFSVI